MSMTELRLPVTREVDRKELVGLLEELNQVASRSSKVSGAQPPAPSSGPESSAGAVAPSSSASSPGVRLPGVHALSSLPCPPVPLPVRRRQMSDDLFQILADELTALRKDRGARQRTSLDKDEAKALHETAANGTLRVRAVALDVPGRLREVLDGNWETTALQSTDVAREAAQDTIRQIRGDPAHGVRDRR